MVIDQLILGKEDFLMKRTTDDGAWLYYKLLRSFRLRWAKNLDPPYQTDLDLWDCLGRVKPVLQQNCIGLIWLFVLILERESPVL